MLQTLLFFLTIKVIEWEKHFLGENAPNDLLKRISKNEDTQHKTLKTFSELNHKLIAQLGFCPEIKDSLKLTVSWKIF